MLAWPATLSFLLNNTYRINDQYWVQGLGTEAQSAIGAMMFVAIMSFAVYYFAAGGTLALVARYEGAGNTEERDRVARHALLLSLAIGAAMCVVGPFLIDPVTSILGLDGVTQAHGASYLRGFFALAPPMVLILAIDHIFIGRGVTIVPMVMQLFAVLFNFILNPILIYGKDLLEAMDAAGMPHFWGLGLLAKIAQTLDIDGLGLEGASLATGLSRTLAGAIGLFVLSRFYGLTLLPKRKPSFALMARIMRISVPVSGSIAIYAGVYWVVYGLVLSKMSETVKAGFSIGFQVFEGISFPTYLGIAMAGSSLVGRALGAKDKQAALAWVGLVRRTGYACGIAFGVLFFFCAGPVAAFFASDPEVAREAVIYARVLAFSQFFVAVETINEKVLLGSGYTKPIGPISLIGNVIRIPLAWGLAIGSGFGAAGVWWAINLSTYFKAFAFRRAVEQGDWLDFEVDEPDTNARETN